ncbi:hypothetical protein [Streptomyces sp. ME18-1-4]|uniref:hypothetical protein n=1 Tax=Streptomyces sp. ME18-1-4 TaxID=3028685 RepID=UPI0029AD25A1|nr:hypothetical protein [Streptomyces sp. ME18-1-4]MDX3246493.1 hypothetical protein [Streptomyces sp. ME18-1-4]
MDDASLERLFLASIKNFLIDEAKKTPRGKLRRRIARLMGEDAVFRRVAGSPPRWALSEHPSDTVWQGDLDDLIAEAWRVRGIGITRWNHSGPTPRQMVHALKTVLAHVLRYARGAVREEELAKALESRFELLAAARFTPLYADEGTLADLAEAATVTPADPTGAGGDTEGIWQRVTANERLILPYLDKTPIRGSAAPSPAAAALEYRGLLADQMAAMSTVRRAPQGSGGLPQLLKKHAVTVQQLADHLQLPPPQALDVWRGQHPLTAEQAQQPATVLGLSADDVLAANPALPPPVVHELSRPPRRTQVRALAAHLCEDEQQARLRAAYGIFTRAARQEDRTHPAWAAGTDRYFELHLGQ